MSLLVLDVDAKLHNSSFGDGAGARGVSFSFEPASGDGPCIATDSAAGFGAEVGDGFSSAPGAGCGVGAEIFVPSDSHLLHQASADGQGYDFPALPTNPAQHWFP